MLRGLPFLFLAAAVSAADAPKPTPQPVEPPPKVEPGESVRPEVTITEGKDKTITEYRINGQLRAIKVQPKGGLPPYYLIDRAGSGQFVRLGPEAIPDYEIPRWVLLEW